jgi:chaperone modulatory protein CbpM
MSTQELISVNELCQHCQVEFSFIRSLEQSGLIHIITQGEGTYVETDQVRELETWIRLNQTLEINLEGIEAISHLLKRIKKMQQELTKLKNRLRLHENPD